MDLDEDQMEAYAAMPESEREKLRQFMNKYRNNAERNPELYGNFIHSVFARAMLEQQMMLENAGSDVEAADPELGLLYRDISQFKDVEIPKAIHIIQDISRKINGELTAKRKNPAEEKKRCTAPVDNDVLRVNKREDNTFFSVLIVGNVADVTN